MNSTHNVVITLGLLALVLLPLIIAACVKAPDETAVEEYDYR